MALLSDQGELSKVSTEAEIAWVAGLLEGEGTFCIRETIRCIHAACAMTDKDVVDRLAATVGFGKVSFVKRTKPEYKDQWKWALTKREPLVRLLEILLPYMGERRSAKIQELLQWHKDNPLQPRFQHGTRSMYQYSGCRCDDCREAERIHRRKQYAKHKEYYQEKSRRGYYARKAKAQANKEATRNNDE